MTDILDSQDTHTASSCDRTLIPHSSSNAIGSLRVRGNQKLYRPLDLESQESGVIIIIQSILKALAESINERQRQEQVIF